MTFVDTAPTYGDGLSEEIVGEAIRGRRDDVVLATKCGPNDDPRASLDASLRRLRTDRIDLLQLHEVPSEPGALERRLDTMRQLVDRGLVRAIGVCNVTHAELSQAIASAPIVSAQLQYNLIDRDAEHDVLAIARSRGVAFLAYRPLASGLFTGKIDAAPQFEGTDHRRRIYWFSGREFERRKGVVDQLKAVAEERGLTVAQLALGWVLARPGVTAVLAGARSIAQVEENAGAAARPLSLAEVSTVDAIVATAYAPRALKRDVRVSREPNANGEFDVTVGQVSGERAMSVGAREAHVMRALDGRMPYSAIAESWSGEKGRKPLLTAQVVLLVDQLSDLGLISSADD